MLRVVSVLAYSEREYLYNLCDLIQKRVMNELPLNELTGGCLHNGSISSPPILAALLGALEFKGYHSKILDACNRDGSHNWILDSPSFSSELFPPPGVSGIQAGVLKVLRSVLAPTSLSSNLVSKVQVTMKVKGETAHNAHFAPNWFSELSSFLQD